MENKIEWDLTWYEEEEAEYWRAQAAPKSKMIQEAAKALGYDCIDASR